MINKRVCLATFFAAIFALSLTQGVFANEKKLLFDAKPLDLPLIYESEITDIQNIQQSRGEDSKTPSFATKASAPALTYLEITYVGSSNAGWEWIDETKLITDEDHGGALMYVVTVELGYGGNPIAKMGGGQLPSSANFQTDTLCWTSGQLGACSAPMCQNSLHLNFFYI